MPRLQRYCLSLSLSHWVCVCIINLFFNERLEQFYVINMKEGIHFNLKKFDDKPSYWTASLLVWCAQRSSHRLASDYKISTVNSINITQEGHDSRNIILFHTQLLLFSDHTESPQSLVLHFSYSTGQIKNLASLNPMGTLFKIK